MKYTKSLLTATSLALLLATATLPSLSVSAQDSSADTSAASTSTSDESKSTQVGLPLAGYLTLPGALEEQSEETTETLIHYKNPTNKDEAYIEVMQIQSSDLPDDFKNAPSTFAANSDMSVYAFSNHAKNVLSRYENLGTLGFGYVIRVVDANDGQRVIYLFQHPDDQNRVVRVTFISQDTALLDDFKALLVTWTPTKANF